MLPGKTFMNFREKYPEDFSASVEGGRAFGSCLVFLLTFCADKRG